MCLMLYGLWFRSRRPGKKGGPSQHQFRNLPPALQPAPFAWTPKGTELSVVTTDSSGSRLESVDAEGRTTGSVAAPDGLSQLVELAP